jgi:hypothetical protein
MGKKEIYEDGVEWVEGYHIHETDWMETYSLGEHIHTHWDKEVMLHTFTTYPQRSKRSG